MGALLLVLAPAATAGRAAAPTSAPAPAAVATFEEDLLQLINDFRAQNGLPPFTESPVFVLMAIEHSTDEVTRGYYDHDEPGGRTFDTRVLGFLRHEGYRKLVAQETLAYTTGGPLDPHDVLQQWLDSPPHRAILLSRDNTQIGIGIAHVDVGTGFWAGDTNVSTVTAIYGPPQPVFQKSVLVATVTGTVLVRAPGKKQFQRLRAATVIPAGSEVDTESGRVKLTSAADAMGDVQTADFYTGRFIVTYLKPPELKPPRIVTNLKLSTPLTCRAIASRRAKKPRRRLADAAGKPKRPRSRKSAAAKSTTVRQLSGDGKGDFRTQGKFASATVQGTVWLTQDTCTTTLVRVKSGVVDVFDFVRKRHVLVRAGQSYTARQR